MSEDEGVTHANEALIKLTLDGQAAVQNVVLIVRQMLQELKALSLAGAASNQASKENGEFLSTASKSPSVEAIEQLRALYLQEMSRLAEIARTIDAQKHTEHEQKKVVVTRHHKESERAIMAGLEERKEELRRELYTRTSALKAMLDRLRDLQCSISVMRSRP